MPKITNYGLTWSGTGCFNSCTDMATVGVKGLTGQLDKIMLIIAHCGLVADNGRYTALYMISIQRTIRSTGRTNEEK